MKEQYIDEMPAILKLHGNEIGDVEFTSHVVGSTFYPNAQEIISLLKKVPQDMIILKFVREPDNEYDCYAVAIYVTLKNSKKEYKIGHVPRDGAPIMSYVLLHNTDYNVVVKNIHIAGGEKGKDNVGLFFDFNIYKINV